MPQLLLQQQLSQDFRLAGDLRLLEAAAETEPNFLLLAYTGKPVRVAGYKYPVLIDMAGVRFDKRTTPVIKDHKTNQEIGHTLEQMILPPGKVGKIGGKDFKGPLIAAVGVPSADTRWKRQFIKSGRKGFPWQVSVGARVLDGYIVAAGETVKVNSQTWEGPLVIAAETLIRELTVTVLGADNDTSAVVAAKAKPGGSIMDFEAFLESLNLKLADLSDEQVTKFKQLWQGQEDPKPPKKSGKKLRAKEPEDEEDEDEEDDRRSRRKVKKGKKILATANGDEEEEEDPAQRYADIAAAEDERIEAIKGIANEFQSVEHVEVDLRGKKTKMTLPSFRSHAIRSKMQPDAFELTLRRAGYSDLGDAGPAIHRMDKDINAKALECAILRSHGVPSRDTVLEGGQYGQKREYGLELMFDEKTLEASHERKYNINGDLNALLAMQVRAAGKHPLHVSGDALFAEAVHAWEEIKASGFSTLSITNILENVMHKEAMAGFESVEGVWRLIAGRKSLNDFRAHALYRLDFSGHIQKVATDGELKHISMIDSKKTIQAETYGAMLTIDRKTRKNDDLGLVLDKARGIGTLYGMRIEEAVMVLLLSNPGSFFHANNNNLISGAGSALGLTSFQTALQKFRDQVINGKPIAVSPSWVLVGTALEILAGQIYNEARIEITTTADTPKFGNNPFVRSFRPIVSGYLNNTAITDQNGKALSNQSATQYYLGARPNAPQGSGLVIGFLDGRESPYIDEAETQFNIPGGLQIRCYGDFGVAMHVTQLLLKSAGA